MAFPFLPTRSAGWRSWKCRCLAGLLHLPLNMARRRRCKEKNTYYKGKSQRNCSKYLPAKIIIPIQYLFRTMSKNFLLKLLLNRIISGISSIIYFFQFFVISMLFCRVVVDLDNQVMVYTVNIKLSHSSKWRDMYHYFQLS